MPERSGVLPAERPRKRMVRMASSTNPDHGKAPAERDVHERLAAGVVALDKPAGPSSHQVSAWLRDALQVERTGHGGTLDPNVTGVLPVTMGTGTKAVQALLTSGKEYVTVMRLHEAINANSIRNTAASFVGDLRQLPPVRSAVARRTRTRRIYYLDVLEVEGRDVLMRVGCEAGTYIRSLCVDLAKALGTRGHMQELRRTRTGLFTESDLVTLHDALDARAFMDAGDASWLLAVVRPVEDVAAHLPAVVLRDTAIDAVCHGAPLAVIGVAQIDAAIEPEQLVRLLSLKGELVGLGRAQMTTEAVLGVPKGIAATAERIIMRTGTYPRTWKKR
jgi:H/ACA ribonucleoprotein complex subunit 4